MSRPQTSIRHAPLGAGLGIGLLAGLAITSQGGLWTLLSMGACVCLLIALHTKKTR
jgi:hypothetical protein